MLLYFDRTETATLSIAPLSRESVPDKLSPCLKVLLIWLTLAREVSSSSLLGSLGFVELIGQAPLSVHFALMWNTFIELLVIVLAAALPSASGVPPV